MQWDVVNLASETVGTVDLDDGVFGVEVRPDILARCVNWQLAKRRAGTHSTKTRGEVARTGKKPYKQKGTGRARQGSSKGPHMRGGGIVFGPRPRDHATDLPVKVRRLALRSALSAKRAAGTLVVLDRAELDEAQDQGTGGASGQARLAQAADHRWRTAAGELRPGRSQPRRSRRAAVDRRQRLRHPAA